MEKERGVDGSREKRRKKEEKGAKKSMGLKGKQLKKDTLNRLMMMRLFSSLCCLLLLGVVSCPHFGLPLYNDMTCLNACISADRECFEAGTPLQI